MTEIEIQNLLEKQRKFYKSGATIPVKFRIEQLKKLYATVKKYETQINDALKTDLGKSHPQKRRNNNNRYPRRSISHS